MITLLGNVCVWDLSLTLTKKFDIFSEILPNLLLYVNLNDNIVTSLCFFEVNGNIYIISASADGSTICMDLRDPDSFVKISKSQGIVHAICAIGSIESILVAEDLRIRGYQMSDDFSEIQASYVTSQHKGAVWMIENSPFFPFLASASSDGALNLANSVRPLKKKIGGVYIYTLFEIISYDNATNTITFNDRLKEKKLEECKLSIWSPRVAVQRIKWNPNRKRKHLIASAGIGWIRIDSALMK
jgi:WD40 repeat protein